MRCYAGWTIQLATAKGRETVAKENDLRTGCSVPDSGIYRVLHSQHRLPREVTLIRDQSFPRCSQCSEHVYFELERSAPEAGGNRHGFAVMLYELPEIAEQEDESL